MGDDTGDGPRETAGERPRAARPRQAPQSSDFGWRGWVLVGVLLVSFLVVPAAILVLPSAQGVIASLGLSLRDAYLVLPLLPAILLGATAVWAALAARRD